MSIELKKENVKVLGRSAVLEAGVALDHSASSLEFTSIGATRIYLTGSYANKQSGNDLYFTVYINGERQAERIKFKPGESTVLVAKELDSTKTTSVKLVRETEEKNGSFTALNLNLGYAGRLGEKPKDNDLYIEFIGDSITCGLGSLCGYVNADNDLTVGNEQSGTGPYKCGVDSRSDPSLCEDASNSYAYLAAEELNADYSFVSFSGIGVTSTNGNIPMSEYYKYASKSRNELYNFTNARKPDLVVINLGTNDEFAYYDPDINLNIDDYKNGVKALIQKVRDSYGPNVKILWATGLMGTALKKHTEAAIGELDKQDNIYHFTKLTQGGDGHSWHPSKDQQKTAAQDLVRYLHEKNIF